MFSFTGSRESGFVLDPVQARREHHREREIRVAAGSGMRSSMRVPMPRRSGTRMSGERLRIDHATFTGASYPGTSRLYEFTSGFVIAHIPARVGQQAADVVKRDVSTAPTRPSAS